ncbi:UDP-N-acetylglucosamine--N-acetylmuramyl-(pentapeptide) pyrophosphoryl-undecaprenol N-acetylglucosamine transferase [Actinomadura logoneensis]|uniref:UDP-N-acetylglucosamine--N-acetylmuramyl-(pentapeptide) pyrophosphoryl-undecaprenol N-acetylglucosamine transferase n=1 Tax=Actinomadura logoneensis TaxID=2293572 RepID=A0A372JHQ9_9ACTN|nr:UDP-N-acetylglucosamine--N-acetylmuramyl-(pentapeptide) pyrophosphoryl-undecaprenol N-acetylglucosamine transferase [Actinomadura logoneensis]RFU39551.1 UDP-N-acetylglucosamine--N-acetylmuramyl-(pentapeptide) pyrophosphoryl-undecaprenol N-acetylglucosamine transferase [Actinomadura logoneensis]
MRLIVTGGGTGGHTYPALTAVRTLQAELAAFGAPPAQVLWVGQADSLEARVAAGDGIEFAAVATGKIRRSANPLRMLSAENIRDMFRVPLGVVQAWSVVGRFRPDVVLATGGYVAVPVGLAAWMRRRPLVVHEQTVRLGLTNRALARVVTRMAVSSDSTLPLLPGSARENAVVTGNPVRPEVLAGHPGKGAAVLGVDARVPTVYVTGGAQGSQQLNTLVLEVLPWLLEHANVVHQCGPANEDALRQATANLPTALAARYRLAGYVGPELPDILALADVVVSRSGAGTIAELTALGKASVLIPLASSAGGEQAHNAQHLERSGAAVALVGEVTPRHLADAVGPLLYDAGRRADMAHRARALGRPDAAARLADVVLATALT